MERRLYPVTSEFFARTILPLIEASYIWKGRPPSISHYQVFCAILYVLRVGLPVAGFARLLWQLAHYLHAVQARQRTRAVVAYSDYAATA